MPSTTEWITAIAGLVVAVMAFLTLLGKFSVPFSKVTSQADDDLLQSLPPRVTELERRVQMQGEKIEELERRLNGPLVLSGHLTEAPSPMTNRG